MNQLNRTIQPATVIPEKLEFIRPEKHQLENGIELNVFNDGVEEVVKLELIFPTGILSASDYSIASAAHSLLDSGIPGKNSEQIAEEFDYYGSYYQNEITPDFKSISLYSINEYLPKTIPLLLNLISNCNYPKRDLEIYKAKSIQNLSINNEKVSWLSKVHFNSLVFGDGTPFGDIPNQKSIEGITREQLIEFKTRSYPWDKCKLILAGKCSDQQIEEIKQLFGSLAISDVPSSDIQPLINETVKPEKKRISKNDVIQCGIRVGRRLFSKNNPDFQGLTVVNTILGGYFGSRLMTNIREDKGYTYGIGSAIIPNLQDGTFFIASEVGKDVVDDALIQVYFELERLTSELVPDHELELVKSYMIGTIQRSIDGPFSLADRYKGLILWNLDYDYLENYIALIHKMTTEKVKELASKYLHPDMMSEVVAG